LASYLLKGIFNFRIVSQLQVDGKVKTVQFEIATFPVGSLFVRHKDPCGATRFHESSEASSARVAMAEDVLPVEKSCRRAE